MKRYTKPLMTDASGLLSAPLLEFDVHTSKTEEVSEGEVGAKRRGYAEEQDLPPVLENNDKKSLW
ncbi:MAG: hypothetical protein IJ163_10480 [Bacteroidaceae bacterium]|nr:hypothetical protein [Bacteroidaceae bacterium]